MRAPAPSAIGPPAEPAAELAAAVAFFHEAYAAWDGAGFGVAADRFDAVAERQPTSAAAHYWRGAALFHRCLYRLGTTGGKADRALGRDLEAAETALAGAVALEPGNGEAHALLATVIGLRIAANPMTAIWRGPAVMNHKNRALALAPRSPRVQYLLGSSYYHAPAILGGREQSLKYFLAAVPLFEEERRQPAAAAAPRWGYNSCLAFIGRWYEDAGDKVAAADYYRQALAVNPRDGLAKEGLGRLAPAAAGPAPAGRGKPGADAAPGYRR